MFDVNPISQFASPRKYIEAVLTKLFSSSSAAIQLWPMHLRGLLALLLLLSSCSQKQAIVGAWQGDDKTVAVEFKPDGTFAILGRKAGVFTLLFGMLSNHELKLDYLLPTNKPTQILQVSISGDQMQMNFSQNVLTQKLHRIDPSSNDSLFPGTRTVGMRIWRKTSIHLEIPLRALAKSPAPIATK